MYGAVANRERGVKEMFQICRLDLNLASSISTYICSYKRPKINFSRVSQKCSATNGVKKSPPPVVFRVREQDSWLLFTRAYIQLHIVRTNRQGLLYLIYKAFSDFSSSRSTASATVTITKLQQATGVLLN